MFDSPKSAYIEGLLRANEAPGPVQDKSMQVIFEWSPERA